MRWFPHPVPKYIIVADLSLDHLNVWKSFAFSHTDQCLLATDSIRYIARWGNTTLAHQFPYLVFCPKQRWAFFFTEWKTGIKLFRTFFSTFPKFNVIRRATSSLSNYPAENICQICVKCVIWKQIHEKCDSVITDSWPTFSNGSG